MNSQIIKVALIVAIILTLLGGGATLARELKAGRLNYGAAGD